MLACESERPSPSVCCVCNHPIPYYSIAEGPSSSEVVPPVLALGEGPPEAQAEDGAHVQDHQEGAGHRKAEVKMN